MMSLSLKKKAQYRKIFNSEKIIQIPILLYSPQKRFNENPYILIDKNFKDKYKKVKGKASEVEYWENILEKFQNGEIDGYKDSSIYSIGVDKIVALSSRSNATLLFWFDDYENFSDEEIDWLEENTDKCNIYFDDKLTTNWIFVKQL